MLIAAIQPSDAATTTYIIAQAKLETVRLRHTGYGSGTRLRGIRLGVRTRVQPYQLNGHLLIYCVLQMSNPNHGPGPIPMTTCLYGVLRMSPTA